MPGRDQLILGLALDDLSHGEPQRLVHAGRQFRRDCAGWLLTLLKQIAGVLALERVKLLLRALHPQPGGAHTSQRLATSPSAACSS